MQETTFITYPVLKDKAAIYHKVLTTNGLKNHGDTYHVTNKAFKVLYVTSVKALYPLTTTTTTVLSHLYQPDGSYNTS